MDHNDIRHKLSEYIDDAVTPQERTAIEEHLKTCTGCADALAELRKTIEQVKQVEEVDAPAWMTSKIMATVREEQEKRTGIFTTLLNYFVAGRAIRVAAVLFLTVTAYYIYISMNPADKYGGAPVGRIAKQETPSPVLDEAKRKAPAREEMPEKKVEQEPGYRSLDMKYSYEKPETPVPAAPGKGIITPPVEQPGAVGAPASAPAPAPAKQEAVSPAAEKDTAEKLEMRQFAARTKAAPAAGKANVAEPSDIQAEARLAVAERFAQKDLPVSMKTKGLRYDVRRFQAELPDLQWMLGTAVYQSNPCADRYVVDVDHAGRQSKYLYCHDKTGARLLGVFELKNDTWTEIK